MTFAIIVISVSILRVLMLTIRVALQGDLHRIRIRD